MNRNFVKCLPVLVLALGLSACGKDEAKKTAVESSPAVTAPSLLTSIEADCGGTAAAGANAVFDISQCQLNPGQLALLKDIGPLKVEADCKAQTVRIHNADESISAAGAIDAEGKYSLPFGVGERFGAVGECPVKLEGLASGTVTCDDKQQVKSVDLTPTFTFSNVEEGTAVAALEMSEETAPAAPTDPNAPGAGSGSPTGPGAPPAPVPGPGPATIPGPVPVPGPGPTTDSGPAPSTTDRDGDRHHDHDRDRDHDRFRDHRQGGFIKGGKGGIEQGKGGVVVGPNAQGKGGVIVPTGGIVPGAQGKGGVVVPGAVQGKGGVIGPNAQGKGGVVLGKGGQAGRYTPPANRASACVSFSPCGFSSKATLSCGH